MFTYFLRPIRLEKYKQLDKNIPCAIEKCEMNEKRHKNTATNLELCKCDHGCIVDGLRANSATSIHRPHNQ